MHCSMQEVTFYYGIRAKLCNPITGSLPFLKLGTTVGVEKVSLSAQGGLSSGIDVQIGFIFGNDTQTKIYVRYLMMTMYKNNVIMIAVDVPISM